MFPEADSKLLHIAFRNQVLDRKKSDIVLVCMARG
ncbi:hypothetical protein SAMN05518672_101808 [Chitinophaga sp. CF118]|nr:hypothetical protein SAMN05518672_101808 [Chitinophaga sp. CF118]